MRICTKRQCYCQCHHCGPFGATGSPLGWCSWDEEPTGTSRSPPSYAGCRIWRVCNISRKCTPRVTLVVHPHVKSLLRMRASIGKGRLFAQVSGVHGGGIVYCFLFVGQLSQGAISLRRISVQRGGKHSVRISRVRSAAHSVIDQLAHFAERIVRQY